MDATPREDNRIQVMMLALAAAASMYLMVVAIAEPIRTTAQATADSEIRVLLASGIALSCSGSLNLGTITGYGDTGPFSDTGSLVCKVTTSNPTGYTLAWLVQSGSGGSNTGHMISEFENVIPAFGTSATVTNLWSVAATDSRWGAHLDTQNAPAYNQATMDFGTAGATGNAEPYASGNARWNQVATGSSVTFGSKGSQSGAGGDDNKVGFRAEVGSNKVQPTGTYRVTVRFTAAQQ